MGTRSRKPHKKQEQPWTKAARARNRAKGAKLAREPATGDPEQIQLEAVVDAVIEMTTPEIDTLPPDATEEHLNTVLGFAMMVYNQPLFEARPDIQSNGESLAAALWKLLLGVFAAVPHARAAYDRMTAHRTLRFSQLKRPILAIEATWDADRRLTVSASLGAEDLHDVNTEDDAPPPPSPPPSGRG